MNHHQQQQEPEQQQQHQQEPEEEQQQQQPTHHQLRLKHYIILSSLSLSFLLLAIIHITIGERLNRNTSPAISRIQHSLVLNIPSTRLKIGDLTAQNTLSLSIQTNLTLDLHRLTTSTENQNGLGKTVEERLLRWLVAKSPNATLSSSSPIQIYEANNHEHQEPLLELRLLEPFILPLSYNVPSNQHPPPPAQRTTIALRIQFLAPARLPPLLLTPALDLRVVLKDLDLRLNGQNGPPSWIDRLFRKLAHVSVPHLAVQLSLPLPKLPPSWTDPSKLLQIDSYSFYPLSPPQPNPEPDAERATPPQPGVGIRASVSAPNPLLLLKQYIHELDLEMHISWRIPLSIFLLLPPSNHTSPSSSSAELQLVPLASSITLPFLLDAKTQNVSMTIEGFLLPSLASSPNHTNPTATATKEEEEEEEESALSGFLNRFLKGKTNDIAIRYRADMGAEEGLRRGMQEEAGGSDQLRFSLPDTALNAIEGGGLQDTEVPSLIVAFLAPLNVRLLFPGSERTELVESIGVREMKIDLPGLLPPHPQLLCSGELRAVVVLPPHLLGLSSILSISDVRPDVLLLDGPLPSSSSPHPQNDTEVFPENAFARLAPDHYLSASLRLLHNSTTPSGSSGVKLLLSSSFVKVPLQVLEGRNAVFRRYAAKYVLHHRRHQTPDDHPDNGDEGGDDDEDKEGVLTSIIGAFDAHSSIALTFFVQLLGVEVRGSFYV